jgi:serine protease Do
MAMALHLTDVRGALIGNVTAGSPAAQAGIQRGDVIREINGERVEDSNQLRLRVSASAPGTTVQLKLLRDGAGRTVSVKLAELPSQAVRNDARESGSGVSNALEGVQVADLNYEVLRELHLPSSTKGVVVTDVASGSPAAMVGLQSGDVIQEVDRERIANTGDFDRAMRRSPGRTVLLLVYEGGSTRYLAVEPR